MAVFKLSAQDASVSYAPAVAAHVTPAVPRPAPAKAPAKAAAPKLSVPAPAPAPKPAAKATDGDDWETF